VLSFDIPRPDGFALTESLRYLNRFRAITASVDEAGVELAFSLDGSWEPVGLHLSEQGDRLRAQVLANPDEAPEAELRRTLDRMFGLSLDFDQYREIGERDPVIAQLQRENPGVRPVRFPNTWEAGVWAQLSQRTRWAQAVGMKQWLSTGHGLAVRNSEGDVLYGFPDPATVRSVSDVPGLSLQRIEWLHGLAEAALLGDLDCDDLAAMSQDEGMAALRGIPGIGPYSAELILARGAGHPDIFPMHEPVLHELMTRLYGVAEKAAHREIAKRWRPYRSWIVYLIRIGA
jgi:DNA-3-methyladenine glycosylase II